MDIAATIRRQLDRTGSTAYLKDGDWTSMPFRAVVQHLWRKKSSNFEPEISELGRVDNQYYLYIGPENHNIKALSSRASLEINGARYEFRCRDAVTVDNRVAYYTGILKKIGEDDENADG